MPTETNASIAQHTPGPWVIHGGPSITVDGADGYSVAFVTRWQRAEGGQDKANAHLIAAAPALLAALKGMLWAVDADVATWYPRLAAECNEARGLIAKAEGRS